MLSSDLASMDRGIRNLRWVDPVEVESVDVERMRLVRRNWRMGSDCGKCCELCAWNDRCKISYFFIFLQDLIRLTLFLDLGFLNLLHALHIFAEIALQCCIDWSIVNGDQVGDHGRVV